MIFMSATFVTHRRCIAGAIDEGGVERRHGHLAGDLRRWQAADVLGAVHAAAPVFEPGAGNVDADQEDLRISELR